MNLNLAFRFLKYYFTAGTKHDAHSPFVYSLVTQVILPDRHSHDFDEIENIRRCMSSNRQIIATEDFGAGHRGKTDKAQPLDAITRNSCKSASYCRLLYRIVNFYQPRIMIELGTSVGISAMYIAKGCPAGELITIEGSYSLARLAESNFAAAGITNIRVISGQFEEKLEGILDDQRQIDFIYIDGNHRRQPTLNYFEQCLEKSHKNTIFVFDDINWNEEMRKTWEIIKSHQKVSITVDLFMMGLVFINPDLSKQDFVIRY